MSNEDCWTRNSLCTRRDNLRNGRLNTAPHPTPPRGSLFPVPSFFLEGGGVGLGFPQFHLLILFGFILIHLCFENVFYVIKEAWHHHFTFLYVLAFSINKDYGLLKKKVSIRTTIYIFPFKTMHVYILSANT